MSLQLSEESLCLSKESSCFPESLSVQIFIIQRILLLTMFPRILCIFIYMVGTIQHNASSKLQNTFIHIKFGRVFEAQELASSTL